uniref:Hyaluronan/mRNA-binding protein domain-containing protein n=2 Tax=Pygocentrus nattereri TaxID=42514 RepID=A0A3B4D525_PYGNA
MNEKLHCPSGAGGGCPGCRWSAGREGSARPGHLCVLALVIGALLRTIGGESGRWGAIMPGHLQDGFGCVVTNRFDQLLDDESDPFEILKAAESRKKEAAAAAGAAGKSAAQAARQPRREPGKDRKNQPGDKKEEAQAPVPLKKDGMRRVGRKQEQQGQSGPPHHQGAPGEGRPGERRADRRPPRERRFEKPAEDKPEGGETSVEKPVGDRPPRGRGGGRGGRGGRGRGMGRGEGFDSRGKRDFDRHSGSDKSGQKADDKRGGAGSHNWGSAKEEASSEVDQSAAPEAPAEGEERAPADSENKENEVEEVKDEGPKEMTLDEWKAMQNKERAKVEFNIRKPNEGEDGGQWKKGYVLHKSKSKDAGRPSGGLIEAGDADADTLHKSASEEGAGDHHFRKPANDITSQLEINFGDLGRPGRGRGGSRGGRGGRGGTRAGRGGSRAEKGGGVSVPNVDDPEAFPALA